MGGEGDGQRLRPAWYGAVISLVGKGPNGHGIDHENVEKRVIYLYRWSKPPDANRCQALKYDRFKSSVSSTPKSSWTMLS
jgi:hypothetical protein